jgi:hypothetical protein
VVFLDNAQMYWRGCLVGPIIVNRTDGVPVTLPPTASSVVPGDLELRMGVLECNLSFSVLFFFFFFENNPIFLVNLSKPLSVRGSLVLAREGRVVLRDCVPGTYQISANIIMGPFNASCECSSGMRAFALQTASTLSVSVSQASDTRSLIVCCVCFFSKRRNSDCAATIAKSATLSPGVIAGIAVAACVVAVLAVLGAVFLMRRSAAKRTEAANSAIMEDELEDLKQHLIENQ